MPKSFLPGIFLGSSLLLAGCVGSLPPRPWLEGEKDWPSVARYEVVLDGKKVPVELAYHISCADAQALWVYVYIHDFSRRDSNVEIRFSPGTAYIEKENGERFVGDPALYKKIAKPTPLGKGVEAGDCKDHSLQVHTGAAARKFTLNSPAHFRFNTAGPDANSRWKLNMGRVFVGGNEIQIPEKNIILRKTQWYMQKIQ